MLLELIGKGSNARVYKGSASDFPVPIAIKLIANQEINKSAKSKKFYLREISSMNKLSHHPHILKLHRVEKTNDYMQLLIDYMPGGDLLRFCRTNKHIPEHDVQVFMQELMETLAFVHSRGIVHRDLKLENILLENKYSLKGFKIADFGFAVDDRESSMLSRCGSPGYIAPEILREEHYDEKVDIFSAGVICYILLTGIQPFTCSSLEKTIARNKSGECSFATSIWTGISSEAISFTMQLLSGVESRPTALQALESPWIKPMLLDSFAPTLTPNSLTSMIMGLDLKTPVESPKSHRTLLKEPQVPIDDLLLDHRTEVRGMSYSPGNSHCKSKKRRHSKKQKSTENHRRSRRKGTRLAEAPTILLDLKLDIKGVREKLRISSQPTQIDIQLSSPGTALKELIGCAKA